MKITTSTTVLPETMTSTTKKVISTTETPTTSTMKITTSTTVLPETMTSTTKKVTSTTETPTTSTEKITTSTTVVPLITRKLTSTTDKTTLTTKEITSSTQKLTTPTLVETTTSTRGKFTSAEKITSTVNTSTTIPFVTEMTKSDNNEEVITALGTIAGVSFIANVILSILLFTSCRRISCNNDTKLVYSNENVSNTDGIEMYTGLDFKEDGSLYQTLAHENEAIYSNANL